MNSSKTGSMVESHRQFLLAAATWFAAMIVPAFAVAPNVVNFQGFLTAPGGTAIDGVRAITVGVYDAPAGGVLLYEELHGVVAVDTGLFEIAIGAGVPTGAGAFATLSEEVFAGADRYLQLTVEAEVLMPRRSLGSVAFALQAQSATAAATAATADDAATLGGLPASDFQQRITGLCAPGSSIRVVNADGSVVCESDDDSDTTYTAGSGLSLAGTTFIVDTAVIQARVSGACAAGSSIRAIAANGVVTCELDNDSGGDITAVSAGSGLSGGGNSGAVTLNIATGGVDATHIGTGAVGSAEIADGAVGDSDASLSLTGSGTATTDTVIRRFFFAETNNWSRARVRIACNGESTGAEAIVSVFVDSTTPTHQYTCPSSGGRPWTYVTPAFDLGTYVDVKYRTTGGGRFYWREIALIGAESGPFIFTSSDNDTTFLTGTCANHAAGNLSFTAPGSGKLVVQSNVWLRVKHSVGTQDETLIALSTTPGDGCTDWPSVQIYSIPASYPTTSGFEIQTLVVHKTFDIAAAGPVTIYLNGRQSLGTSPSTDNLWWAGTVGTFYPD